MIIRFVIPRVIVNIATPARSLRALYSVYLTHRVIYIVKVCFPRPSRGRKPPTSQHLACVLVPRLTTHRTLELNMCPHVIVVFRPVPLRAQRCVSVAPVIVISLVGNRTAVFVASMKPLLGTEEIIDKWRPLRHAPGYDVGGW